MTRIAVHGAAGRMGRSVIGVVLKDEKAQLTGAIEHAGHAALGSDSGVLVGNSKANWVLVSADLDQALGGSEVVIDFSAPPASAQLLLHCAQQKKPAVVGTTGMDATCTEALHTLAQLAPVVYAPNFSVGVNILWALCERAVQLAGDEFDLEIIEMHHRHKVDAPSGTAVRLEEVVAKARGQSFQDVAVYGRNGLVGARKSGEIGVHALRGGDVVGDHTLVMAGPGERIELTHRAHTREIFARGAVRAAHWVVGKKPGLYDMADVLGLRG